MPRKYSLRAMHLTRPARTAAVMLSSVQNTGDASHRPQGIDFWLNDWMDATILIDFEKTFGVTITEFLEISHAGDDPRKLAQEAARLLAERKAA